MIEGFLLVDKEGGWTSHDVVAKCRGILGERKIGHAGTLDPLATGLLVLGVGRATRLLRYVQGGVKRYEARVAFGIATDTLDADGAILEREPMNFAPEELSAVAARFVGSVSQVPPMVSAVKVGGKRLYDLARQGIDVEREARTVQIHEIEVLDVGPGPYPEAEIVVRCGAGTYIRTLADDLARALGGRAHLTALRRTAIGSHDVGHALTVEALEALDEPATALLSMADGLGELESAVVDKDTALGVSNGVIFAAAAIGAEEPGSYRVMGPDGALLAVYSSDGRRAKPEVVVA
ncbi:MAG: tRNA pseudouridine(55) synthase TruB [Acidimicrobiia bacterium]